MKIKYIRKTAGAAALAAVIGMSALTVPAQAAVSDQPYLSLGADLTSSERSKVLELLGVDESKLDDYTIMYVTNEEEYQYLGDYLSAETIGKEALSSVLVTPAEKGSGIDVTTKNISYCTLGMYENALATAGADDIDVVVAGPFSITGTSALVGTIKAYADMTGEEAEDEVIDAAVDELLTTGSLEESMDVDAETVEGMIAYVKQEIADGNTDLDAVIDEGEKQFNVKLSDEEREMLKSLLEKLSHIDLNLDTLTEQANSVYQKLKDMGSKLDFSSLGLDDINVTTEDARNFFQKLIDFIRSLFN